MSTEVTVISANKQDTIDLSQPAGLQAFSLSVREVYQTAKQYEAIARTNHYAQLTLSDVSGEEVFVTIHGLWGDVQRDLRRAQMVIENAGELSPQAVAQMQRSYDGLFVLRDYVKRAYAGMVNRQQQSDVAVVSQENVVQATYDEIEGSINESSMYLEAVKARIHNQLSAEKAPAAGAAALQQLAELQEKVKTLQSRIAKSRSTVRDLTVVQQARAQYASVVQQVSEQAAEIESGVRQRFQSVTTGTTTAAVNANVITAREGRVESNGVVLETSVMEAADVCLRQVTEHPFYTRDERSTVDDLYQEVQESVARGSSPSVQDERLAALAAYVQSLAEAPEVAGLVKRTAEIVRRVTASLPFDSDTLRTVRMLERKCKEALADQTRPQSEKIATYHLLEEYVMSHENEWLLVCGMRVPMAGESGVVDARKMREVLLVERDRNQAFIQDQRKQVMVDKLIRKLSFIPPAGFDENDVKELKDAIRAIDVPNQQVKHHDHLLSTVDEALPELGVQLPQHHSLRVSGDDESANLSITVALRSSRRSKARRKKHSIEQVATAADAQLVDAPPSADESALIASLEKADPVVTAIPSLTPRVFPPAPNHEKRSLIKLYLSAPFYQDFIDRHYTSAAAFERMLDTIVTQIESKTTDVFERWLGEEKASAFLFMEEQTVADVLRLAGDRDVRQILAEQNIKYETFLTWIDMLDEMQAVVGEDLTLQFGALYARWVIESEMIFAQESVGNNSQI